jgi:antimicrobial peptide system SdpA family protein
VVNADSAAVAVDPAATATRGGGSAQPDPRLGRRVALAALVCGLLVAAVLSAALPASAFDPFPTGVKRTVAAALPEGWSFFTKSPRDPSTVVYGREPDGRWRDITAGPSARPGRLMGLNRAGRAQGTEIAVLTDQMPAGAWQHCDRPPLDCLSGATVSATVTNTSHRTVCGDVGFVVQEVLPWAWRDAPTVMPSNVARVRVAC